MIKLTHLALVGTNVGPAIVDFGPELSVVHGPSDTGKSFIVDAIDFALGSKKLKQMKGVENFSHVILGVRTTSDESFSIVRPIKGGRVGLYEGEIRSLPVSPPERTLATQHNANSEDNLSRFLLNLTGFDGRRVRKNLRNDTDSLSFRNLAHFAVVDETQMQSELEPVYTGTNPTTRTKEVSVLKLLLEGRDDSDLTPLAASPQQNRAKAAKAEVVEALIRSIEEKLQTTAEEQELRDQLARVNHSISSLGKTLSESAENRAQALQRVADSEDIVRSIRTEYSSTSALGARLSLLETQYASDLSRLDMIREAGGLLGFFTSAICPFCGNAVVDDSTHEIDHEEVAPFGAAVTLEISKTERLREDLQLTLAGIGQEQTALREDHAHGVSTLREHREALVALDAESAPAASGLQALLKVRSEVEQSLGAWDQLSTYRALLADIQSESAVEKAAAGEAIRLLTIDAFSAQISELLSQWGYPDSEHARYDRSDNDIVADGQLRSGHGKGVRAVLHAAFSIALAQHCIAQSLPHPGFVVLDSPLVTYKPPKVGEADLSADAALLPEDFTTRFYASVEDLASNVQVIIMENVSPSTRHGNLLHEIEFTKSADSSGRYGFFPHSSPPKS